MAPSRDKKQQHLLKEFIHNSPAALFVQSSLVGGFNPSQKYQSVWIISPNRVENKTYLKPPTSSSPITLQGIDYIPPSNKGNIKS